MQRAQIMALSLGGAVAVAAGVMAWHGWPPGREATATATAKQMPAAPPPKSDVATSEGVAPHLGRAGGSKAAATPPIPAKRVTAAPVSTPAMPASVPAAPAPAPRLDAAAKQQSVAMIPRAKLALPPPGEPRPSVPRFDTVRVEPTGDTVVAGHADAGAEIDLLADAHVIGHVRAGDAGDFVIVPDALAPGNYVLALRARLNDGPAVQSAQTITVSVPAKGQTGVIVALTEPGKASVLLSDPTAKPAPPTAEAKPRERSAAAEAAAKLPARAAAAAVAFKTAEAANGSFYATGIAAPGAHLRIYLNGSALADITADARGRWSMTIRKGVIPGHYTIRADALDARGKVTARAEVPFDMPAPVAAKLEPAPAARGKGPAEIGHNAPAKPAPMVAAVSSRGGGGHVAPVAPISPEGKLEGIATVPVATSAPPPATAANAVVPEIDTATVARGDSLWRISRKAFGRGVRYILIYAANASQIRDPDLIYPGQVFVLPRNHVQ